VLTVRERIAATGQAVPSPVVTFGFSVLAFAVAAAAVRWANRRRYRVFSTGEAPATGAEAAGAALGTTSLKKAPLSGRR
jgi:hypothetical protein